jgi:fumarate reductase flavoprotein subunit
VHKGDLTGIEIINRLAEQVWARGIDRLEEHRALDLIKDANGELAGVLMLDMRTGKFVFVQAKAVLLATGGGPTMYKFHTPSGEKSCDGMAMALRAGLSLRDMEMVQFHPTGLLAGPKTRMTGTVLEEGLRGSGGYLLDGRGERFMHKYDPRNERATRDIVSRGIYREMRSGNTTPNGGVFVSMGHLGIDNVRRQFKGMVERCADCGFDLAGGLVEVVPTAHYMMGGVEFDSDCSTALVGLFAAGEDTGGVHGANRLGGNGVANSTVFGGVAGDEMAAWVAVHGRWRDPDAAALSAALARARAPFSLRPGNLPGIRDELAEIMWNDVGILRDDGRLKSAAGALGELDESLERTGIAANNGAFNLTWHNWLDLKSLILVSRCIAAAATVRENSRGAHFREDFPDAGNLDTSAYTRTVLRDGAFDVRSEPVRFTRVRPGESCI